jgi:pimeloyl-ACP methyl ester carboxylesterase
MHPWLPIAPFFRHEIDAAAPLRKARVPTAIIAAEHDQIVHAERTDSLRHSGANVVYDRTIRGAGHNDIYTRSEFHDAMHEALDRLTA